MGFGSFKMPKMPKISIPRVSIPRVSISAALPHVSSFMSSIPSAVSSYADMVKSVANTIAATPLGPVAAAINKIKAVKTLNDTIKSSVAMGIVMAAKVPGFAYLEELGVAAGLCPNQKEAEEFVKKIKEIVTKLKNMVASFQLGSNSSTSEINTNLKYVDSVKNTAKKLLHSIPSIPNNTGEVESELREARAKTRDAVNDFTDGLDAVKAELLSALLQYQDKKLIDQRVAVLDEKSLILDTVEVYLVSEMIANVQELLPLSIGDDWVPSLKSFGRQVNARQRELLELAKAREAELNGDSVTSSSETGSELPLSEADSSVLDPERSGGTESIDEAQIVEEDEIGFVEAKSAFSSISPLDIATAIVAIGGGFLLYHISPLGKKDA